MFDPKSGIQAKFLNGPVISGVNCVDIFGVNEVVAPVGIEGFVVVDVQVLRRSQGFESAEARLSRPAREVRP